MHDAQNIAAKLLGVPYGSLDERTQRVARHVAERRHIARNLQSDDDVASTRGGRAADAVARFGGSWVFIGLFAVVHDKVDLLREGQWRELLAVQTEQLDLLRSLLAQSRREENCP